MPRGTPLLTLTFLAACAAPEGGPAPQVGADRDALVAGTPYNATAEVACAGYRDNPPGRCPAGVVRRTHGSADVTMAWPDGGSRTLFFNPDGSPLTADTSEAAGSAAFTPTAVRQPPDLTIVSIGPERYEIPDVFLQGD